MLALVAARATLAPRQEPCRPRLSPCPPLLPCRRPLSRPLPLSFRCLSPLATGLAFGAAADEKRSKRSGLRLRSPGCSLPPPPPTQPPPSPLSPRPPHPRFQPYLDHPQRLRRGRQRPFCRKWLAWCSTSCEKSALPRACSSYHCRPATCQHPANRMLLVRRSSTRRHTTRASRWTRRVRRTREAGRKAGGGKSRAQAP